MKLKNAKQSQNKANQSQFFGGQTLILAQKWGFSTNLEQPFYAKQSQFFYFGYLNNKLIFKIIR
jgi:hypothetical protein